MTEEHFLQCSRCGSDHDVHLRLAVCGATTQIQLRSSPDPGSTATQYNNIKLWRLMLCKQCLPVSYRGFLRRDIRMAAKGLAICAFFGLIAFLVWWCFMGGEGMNVVTMPGLDKDYLVVIFVGAAIGGVVGVPLFTIMLLLDYRQLYVLQQTGTVPTKRLDKSFVGEGQRVIEALKPNQPNTGEKVFGTFPLPLQMKRDGQEVTLEEESRQRYGFGKREIVAVGKNLDELERALPTGWKSLLISRKAKRDGVDQNEGAK